MNGVRISVALVEQAWRAVGWAMVLAICVLSLVPVAGPPLPVVHGDKWSHLLAYGIVTCWWGMLHRRAAARWLLCGAFAAMGVALEFAQQLTDYRTLDPFDMLADAIGALLGRFAVETRIGRLLPTR